MKYILIAILAVLLAAYPIDASQQCIQFQEETCSYGQPDSNSIIRPLFNVCFNSSYNWRKESVWTASACEKSCEADELLSTRISTVHDASGEWRHLDLQMYVRLFRNKTMLMDQESQTLQNKITGILNIQNGTAFYVIGEDILTQQPSGKVFISIENGVFLIINSYGFSPKECLDLFQSVNVTKIGPQWNAKICMSPEEPGNSYGARQRVRENSKDTGISEEQFIKAALQCDTGRSYDPKTKTFYESISYDNGTWGKFPTPIGMLEEVAEVTGYFGKIPLE